MTTAQPNRFRYAVHYAYGPTVVSNHGTRADVLQAYVAGFEPERIGTPITRKQALRMFGADALSCAQASGEINTHVCYDRRHCPDA